MKIKLFKTLLYISIFVLISCNSNEACQNLKNNEVLLEHKEFGDTQTYLIRKDSGAFGYTGILKICDSQKNFVEKIGLRVEDNVPTVDSVIKHNIYLHYTITDNNKSKKSEQLEFDNVVLGEALINPQKLKFKYHFYAHYIFD